MKHTFSVKTIEDEGGKTKCIHHTITFEDGYTLKFSERNIFDFGRVINPEYSINEGMESGGLVSFNKETGQYYWMDFKRSVYQVGEHVGGYDEVVNKHYDKWILPLEYNVRRRREMTDIFGFEMNRDIYEIVDRDGNVLTGILPASGSTLELALRQAYYLLCVKRIENGGWYKVRNLTPREVEAYRYLLEHGYYSKSSIRMYIEPNPEIEIAKQEAALELACENGVIPGAMPADI